MLNVYGLSPLVSQIELPSDNFVNCQDDKFWVISSYSSVFVVILKH